MVGHVVSHDILNSYTISKSPDRSRFPLGHVSCRMIMISNLTMETMKEALNLFTAVDP